MKFLKWLVILVIVLGGGTYFYGRSMPREHRVSSTVVLVASADTVWKTIRNVPGTAAWWGDLKSATRVRGTTRETWEEDMGAMGKLQIEITRESPPTQLVTTILGAEEQGWGGKWTYDIRSTGSGTEVTITEEGFVNSPMFRVVMSFMGQYRTMDSYLSSLGGHFGEPVTPRHGESGTP